MVTISFRMVLIVLAWTPFFCGCGDTTDVNEVSGEVTEYQRDVPYPGGMWRWHEGRLYRMTIKGEYIFFEEV